MEPSNQAKFRFYEELNDFLPKDRRKKNFEYVFSENPSIKDAIEAIGVPHTEIEIILVNGTSVDFGYLLQDGDCVSVYPVFENFNVTSLIRLRDRPLRSLRFILDTQLGKLCKYLRLLGFDAIYKNIYFSGELIDIALGEKRVILTRDRKILKHKRVTHGYWLRSEYSDKQVCEVLKRFDLYHAVKPFSRCLVCNGFIEKIEKIHIVGELPENISEYFDCFARCANCGKIYWEGSHYIKMKKKINEWLNIHKKVIEMNGFLSKVFDLDGNGKEAQSARVEKHDVRIAACALFLEMANIDDEFSSDEKEKIISVLKEEYELSEEHASKLADAANEELRESLDLWTFTNRINNNFTMDEKIRVVELLWRVVYADGKLDKHEDYLVHKLAEMLNLDHKQLIDAKLNVLYSEEK